MRPCRRMYPHTPWDPALHLVVVDKNALVVLALLRVCCRGFTCLSKPLCGPGTAEDRRLGALIQRDLEMAGSRGHETSR